MTERALTIGQKTLIDLGPLVVFFAINYFYGIMIGTAALMATTLAVIIITFLDKLHLQIFLRIVS